LGRRQSTSRRAIRHSQRNCGTPVPTGCGIRMPRTRWMRGSSSSRCATTCGMRRLQRPRPTFTETKRDAPDRSAPHSGEQWLANSARQRAPISAYPMQRTRTRRGDTAGRLGRTGARWANSFIRRVIVGHVSRIAGNGLPSDCSTA